MEPPGENLDFALFGVLERSLMMLELVEEKLLCSTRSSKASNMRNSFSVDFSWQDCSSCDPDLSESTSGMVLILNQSKTYNSECEKIITTTYCVLYLRV